MKKPEKLKMTNVYQFDGETHNRWISGYNQACDDWEAYLKEVASIEKIRNIIQEITEKHFAPITIGYREDLAKVVSESIRGEK